VGLLGMGDDILLVSNINTIKNELPATFASLRIIVYPAILDVNQARPPQFLEYGPPAGALHA
jgi:hypothetical protein